METKAGHQAAVIIHLLVTGTQTVTWGPVNVIVKDGIRMDFGPFPGPERPVQQGIGIGAQSLLPEYA